jgi:hypothetical protein
VKSLQRLAVPIALIGGAVVFLCAHVLLQRANWPLGWELIADAALYLLSAFAIWSLIDNRSRQELETDAYADEAEERVRTVRAALRQARDGAKKIANPNVKQLVAQIAGDTDLLIDKIRAANPGTLQSSAVILSGHLESLNVVIQQYAEIERQARYFDDPEAKLQAGEAALHGFEEFLAKSIKLLEQGDTLNYAVALKGLEATKYSALT